ncbi:olfactory receptor 7E24-like [Nannospalax galili]|uniref:olfactory receptor 7E24-like n=1 Tax=Nannospalax galili TaxID=1026970 RepID=UPI00111C62CF|nr:olfactory receptor 7E24-like [Nannospalax galili]
MYFFLSTLSWPDIGFISTTIPKLIVNIQSQSTVISYAGCLTQMSLFIIFGCMDVMLLTVMVYDQFVATCHSLNFSVIMNTRFCVLVLMSFFFTFVETQLHLLIALQMRNFKDVEIDNFFCDASQVFNLSCSDTFKNNTVQYLVGILYGMFPISGIVFS